MLFSQWQVIAKKEGEDLPLDMIVVENNDFIVASSNTGQDSSGLVLSRYNTNGSLIWSKLYFTAGGIFGNGSYSKLLNNDVDQSFYLFTRIENNDNYYVISKLNSLGDQIWTKSFNLDFSNAFLLSDGSLLLDGGKCRIDNNGNLLWIKSFSSNECYDIMNLVSFKAFKELSNQTYLAGGYAGEAGMLVKFNYQGDTIWTSGRTLPAGPSGVINNICQINSNAFVFTNLTASVIALDSSGVPIWSSVLSDGSNVICKKAFAGTGGVFFIAGQTNGQGNGNNDIFISKHNENGAFMQAYTIGGNLSDELIDAEIDSNGDLLLLCRTLSFNSLGFDIYLIKVPLSSLEICFNALPANFSVPVNIINNTTICHGIQSTTISNTPFDSYNIENTETSIETSYICESEVNSIPQFYNINNQNINLVGNLLEVSKEFYLCDITGRVLFRSDRGNVILKSGVYIIVIDGLAHKIIL